MFKEGDLSSRQRVYGCFLYFFYFFYTSFNGKKSVGFCIKTGKRFFLET